MIILGLDPGTKTGWAICRDGKVRESGVQTFALSRGESPGMRFLRFRSWLTSMPLIDVFAFEQAHHRGGAATHVGVGMSTRIEEIAVEVGSESLPVHTGTLKKWACGNGRASKQDMIDEAQERTGVLMSDRAYSDDEADAILVALWAWEQVGAK